MDRENTQSFIQSRTIVFLLTALVAKLLNLAAAHWGLPLVPADVQAEAVGALQTALDVVLTGAILLAMRFRAKATAVIDRWW